MIVKRHQLLMLIVCMSFLRRCTAQITGANVTTLQIQMDNNTVIPNPDLLITDANASCQAGRMIARDSNTTLLLDVDSGSSSVTNYEIYFDNLLFAVVPKGGGTGQQAVYTMQLGNTTAANMKVIARGGAFNDAIIVPVYPIRTVFQPNHSDTVHLAVSGTPINYEHFSTHSIPLHDSDVNACINGKLSLDDDDAVVVNVVPTGTEQLSIPITFSTPGLHYPTITYSNILMSSSHTAHLPVIVSGPISGVNISVDKYIGSQIINGAFYNNTNDPSCATTIVSRDYENNLTITVDEGFPSLVSVDWSGAIHNFTFDLGWQNITITLPPWTDTPENETAVFTIEAYGQTDVAIYLHVNPTRMMLPTLWASFSQVVTGTYVHLSLDFGGNLLTNSEIDDCSDSWWSISVLNSVWVNVDNANVTEYYSESGCHDAEWAYGNSLISTAGNLTDNCTVLVFEPISGVNIAVDRYIEPSGGSVTINAAVYNNSANPNCSTTIVARDYSNVITLTVDQGRPNLVSVNWSGAIHNFTFGTGLMTINFTLPPWTDSSGDMTATFTLEDAEQTDTATTYLQVNPTRVILPTLWASSRQVVMNTFVDISLRFDGDPLTYSELEDCSDSWWSISAADYIFVNAGAANVSLLYNISGCHDTEWAYGNSLISTVGNLTDNCTVEVVAPISGLSIEIASYTLNNGTVGLYQQMNSSCPPIFGRDVVSTIYIGVESGIPYQYVAFFNHSTMFNSSVDANLNGTMIISCFQAGNCSILTVLAEGWPGSTFPPANKTVEVTPILMNPIIKVMPSAIYVPENTEVSFTIKSDSVPFLEDLDFGDNQTASNIPNSGCGCGRWSLDVEGNIYTNIQLTDYNYTFTTEGDYNVSVFYHNEFGDWQDVDDIVIHVVRNLANLSVTFNQFWNNGTFYSIPPVDDPICPPLISRDTMNTLSVSVQSGIASAFQLRYSGQITTNAGPGPWLPNVNVCNAPPNCSQMSVAALPQSDALSILSTVIDLTPIIVDPTITVTADNRVIPVGDQATFTIVSSTGFMEEYDFDGCGCGQWTLDLGSIVAVGIKSPNITLTFNTSGEYPVLATYKNKLTQREIAATWTFIVTSPLAGLTLDFEDYMNGTVYPLNHTAIGLSDATCPLVIARDVNSTMHVSVLDGVASNFSVLYSNIKQTVPASNSSNATMSLHPCDWLSDSNNCSVIMLEAAGELNTIMKAVYVWPVAVDSVFTISADPSYMTVDMNTTIRIAANPQFNDDYDLGGCGCGSWTLEIGELIYSSINAGFITANQPFNSTGLYNVTARYKNKLTSRYAVQNVTITVVEQFTNLSIVCDSYLSPWNQTWIDYPANHTTMSSLFLPIARNANSTCHAAVFTGYPEYFSTGYNGLTENHTVLSGHQNATIQLAECVLINSSNNCSLLMISANPSEPVMPVLNTLITSVPLWPLLVQPMLFARAEPSIMNTAMNTTITITSEPPFIDSFDFGGAGGGFLTLELPGVLTVPIIANSSAILLNLPFNKTGVYNMTVTYTNLLMTHAVFTNVTILVAPVLENITATTVDFLGNLTNQTMPYIILGANFTREDGIYLAVDAKNLIQFDVLGPAINYTVNFTSVMIDGFTSVTNGTTTALLPPYTLTSYSSNQTITVTSYAEEYYIDPEERSFISLPIRVDPHFDLIAHPSTCLPKDNVQLSIAITNFDPFVDLADHAAFSWSVATTDASVVVHNITGLNVSVTFPVPGIYNFFVTYRNALIERTINASISVNVLVDLEGVDMVVTEYRRLSDNTMIQLNNNHTSNDTFVYVARDAYTNIIVNLTTGTPAYYSLLWNQQPVNITTSSQSSAFNLNQPFTGLTYPNNTLAFQAFGPDSNLVNYTNPWENRTVGPILVDPTINLIASQYYILVGQQINISLDVAGWIPGIDDAEFARFHWSLSEYYNDTTTVVTVGYTELVHNRSYDAAGAYTLSVIFNNALIRKPMTANVTIYVFDDLSGVNVSVTGFLSSRDNSSIALKTGAVIETAEGVYVPRDALSRIDISLQHSTPAYYSISTGDSTNYTTNLNFTSVTHPPFNIVSASTTGNYTLVVQAHPPTSSVPYGEPWTNRTAYPILVDPIWNITASDYEVLVDAVLNISINIENWMESIDGAEFSNFTWSLSSTGFAYQEGIKNFTTNVAFSVAGVYQLDAIFENALIKQYLNHSINITVYDDLKNVNLTVISYKKVSDNSSIPLKVGAIIETAVGVYFPRDAYIVVDISIQQGTPAYYAVYTGSTQYTNFTSNQANITRTIPPYNYLYLGQNSTVSVQAFPPTSIVPFASPFTNRTVWPILVDPVWSIASSEYYVVTGTQVNISISINNWIPLIDESEEANFTWSFRGVLMGLRMPSLKSLTANVTMNVSGPQPIDAIFDNAIVHIYKNASITINVIDDLTGLTLNVTAYNRNNDSSAIALRPGAIIETSEALYVARDAINRLGLALATGVPGGYVIYWSTLINMTTNLTSPAYMIPQWEYSSAPGNHTITVQAYPPDNNFPYSSPLINRTVWPILVDPTISLFTNKTAIEIDEVINVTLLIENWIPEVDEAGFSMFSWSIKTDLHNIPIINTTSTFISFNLSGVYTLHAVYSNALIQKNIAVANIMRNLNIHMSYPLVYFNNQVRNATYDPLCDASPVPIATPVTVDFTVDKGIPIQFDVRSGSIQSVVDVMNDNVTLANYATIPTIFAFNDPTPTVYTARAVPMFETAGTVVETLTVFPITAFDPLLDATINETRVVQNYTVRVDVFSNNLTLHDASVCANAKMTVTLGPAIIERTNATMFDPYDFTMSDAGEFKLNVTYENRFGAWQITFIRNITVLAPIKVSTFKVNSTHLTATTSSSVQFTVLDIVERINNIRVWTHELQYEFAYDDGINITTANDVDNHTFKNPGLHTVWFRITDGTSEANTMMTIMIYCTSTIHRLHGAWFTHTTTVPWLPASTRIQSNLDPLFSNQNIMLPSATTSSIWIYSTYDNSQPECSGPWVSYERIETILIVIKMNNSQATEEARSQAYGGSARLQSIAASPTVQEQELMTVAIQLVNFKGSYIQFWVNGNKLITGERKSDADNIGQIVDAHSSAANSSRWQFTTSSPSASTEAYVMCERDIDQNNRSQYSITVQGGGTYLSTSPIDMAYNGNETNFGPYTTIVDNTHSLTLNESNSTGTSTIFVREFSTTLPVIGLPVAGILNKNVSINLLAPYKNYETIFVQYWAQSPTNLTRHFFTGSSANSNHDHYFAQFDELGLWEVWAIVYTGVSTLATTKQQLEIRCDTLSMGIASALFSYHGNNGTHYTEWTHGDWKNYTDNPTVEFNHTTAVYIYANYGNTAQVCTGNWLQYDSKEITVRSGSFVAADASSKCTQVLATLAPNAADRNDLHAYQTAITHLSGCTRVWIAGGQLLRADGQSYSPTGGETACALCYRERPYEQNFTLTVNDTIVTKATGQGPIFLRLPGRSPDGSNKRHDIQIQDHRLHEGGYWSTFDTNLWTRESFPLQPRLVGNWIGLIGCNKTFHLVPPFNSWYDTFESRFYWEKIGSVPTRMIFGGYSGQDDTATAVSLPFEEIGDWRVWVTINNGVDDTTASATITIVCNPVNSFIVQVFFNYGRMKENGSNSEYWTSADWQNTWIDNSVTHTIKYDDIALFYMATEYSDGSLSCSGRWLQYMSGELYLSDDILTPADAVVSCADRNATFGDQLVNAAYSPQLIRVILNDLNGVTVTEAWFGQNIMVHSNGTASSPSTSTAAHYICSRSLIRTNNVTLTTSSETTSSPAPLFMKVTRPSSDENQIVEQISVTNQVLQDSDIFNTNHSKVNMRSIFTVKPTIRLQPEGMFGWNITTTVNAPYDNWYYKLKIQWTWQFNGLSIENSIIGVDMTRYGLPLDKIGKWWVKVTIFNGVDHIESEPKAIQIIPLSGMSVLAQYPFNGDMSVMHYPEFWDWNQWNLTLADFTMVFEIKYNFYGATDHNVTVYDSNNVIHSIFTLNTTHFNLSLAPGKWTIQVAERESLYSLARNLSVTCIEKIPTLDISTVGSKPNVGEKTQLRMTFAGKISQYDCLTVQWDINEEAEELTSYGSEYHCSQWAMLANATRHGGNYSNGFLAEHVYSKDGDKKLLVTAYNFASIETQFFYLTVASSQCWRPQVEFLDSSQNPQKPVNIKCGYKKLFSMRVELACPYTNKVVRQWTIEKVDRTTGIVTDIIDLTSLGPLINNYNQLQIPERFICFGLHRVTFTISLDRTKLIEAGYYEEVTTEVIGYFNTVPSEITALLTNDMTNYVTVGSDPQAYVATNAGVNSLNPNTETTNVTERFDRYQYVCRVQDSGKDWPFTDDFHEYLPSGNPQPIDKIDHPATPNGCFGGGPGALWKQGPVFDVFGFWFRSNYSYEFGVRIWKTYNVDGILYEMMSETFLELFVTYGDPPKLKVTCETNLYCNQKENHVRVTDLADTNFRCQCTSCDVTSDLKYEWIFTKKLEFASFNLTAPYIPDVPEEMEGINKQVLTIAAGFWTANPSVKEMEAKCKITNLVTGESAMTNTQVYVSRFYPPAQNTVTLRDLRLQRNEVPEGPDCVVQPMNGTAMQTNFRIICRDWYDNDDDNDQLKYEYSYVNNEGEKYLISTVPMTYVHTQLPNCTCSVEVKVYDPLGATSRKVVIPNVQSHAVPWAHYDPFSSIVTAHESGDPPTVISSVVSIAESLNEASKTTATAAIQEKYSDSEDPYPYQESIPIVEGTHWAYNGEEVDLFSPNQSEQIVDKNMISKDYDYSDSSYYVPSGAEVLSDYNLDVPSLLDLHKTSGESLVLGLAQRQDGSTGDVTFMTAAQGANYKVTKLSSGLYKNGTVNKDLVSKVLASGFDKPAATGANALLFMKTEADDPENNPEVVSGVSRISIGADNSDQPNLLGVVQFGTKSDIDVSVAMLIDAPLTITDPAMLKAAETGDFSAFDITEEHRLKSMMTCMAEMMQVAAMTEPQQGEVIVGDIPHVPSQEIAGQLIMEMPDGQYRTTKVHADTTSTKVIKLTDPQTGAIGYAPVQITTTGVAHIDPKHLHNEKGESLHAGIPGAPDWASIPAIRVYLQKLQVIVIPMTIQACDELLADCDDNTIVRQGCLRRVKEELDVMNDAVSDINQELIVSLDSINITPDNMLAAADAIYTVASQSITYTVNVVTGKTVPASAMDAESIRKSASIISMMSQKLIEPGTVDEMSPEQSRDIAKSLLRSVTAVANAQMLSRYEPLAKDQYLAYLKEFWSYETVLPANYEDNRRADELTQEEWGYVAAVDQAVLNGEAAAKQFDEVVRAIEILAIRDMAKLENDDMLSEEITTEGACFSLRIGRLVDVIKERIGDLFKCAYIAKMPQNPCDLITKGSCDLNRVVKLRTMFFGNNYRQMSKIKAKANTNNGLLDIEISDIGSDPIAVINTRQPIDIIFRQPSLQLAKVFLVQPEAHTLMERREFFSVHRIEMSRYNASILVNVRPLDLQMRLALYFSKKYPGPMESQHDNWVSMPQMTDEGGSLRFNWMIPPDSVQGYRGPVYVAIGRIVSDVVNPDNNMTVKWNNLVFSRNFSAGYRFRALTKGCYFLDTRSEEWHSSGMKPLTETSPRYLRCTTNHLTAFSAGLFVPPHSINYEFVFNNGSFLTNLSIYATVIFLMFTLIVLGSWARWMDTRDVRMLESLPISDNRASDTYVYELLVRTGYGQNAATDSKVSVILMGDRGQTEVRDLICTTNNRRTFRNGAVDSFILTTKEPLGNLHFVRLWHNNAGDGKFQGWYCSYVTVIDCQSGVQYPFLVDKWLAVDEEDGIIERMVPLATRLELAQFTHQLQRKARTQLTDGHLWFSLFSRPARSRFTRTQRLGCIYSLITTSMLASAIWYGTASEPTGLNALNMGPFQLSMELIGISILCNLISMPLNFFIMHLFRKAKLRHRRPNHVVDALQRAQLPLLPVDKKKQSDVIKDRQNSGFIWDLVTAHLPWWTRTIAWLLCACSIIVSIFFVLSYGIQFGDSKTRKWLSSMLISVFMSVLLTHPIKLLFMAIFCTCVCKSSTDTEYENMEMNEEQLLLQPHLATNYGKKGKVFDEPIDQSSHEMMQEILDADRVERLKEKRMMNLVKEIFVNLSFTCIVLMISSGNLDIDTFRFVSTTRSYYEGHWGLNHFMKIRNVSSFYDWANDTLVNSTRAFWYHGQPPYDMRGFTMDKASRMLGYTVIRQIRQEDSSCSLHSKVRHLFGYCADSTSFLKEDTKNYGVGWSKLGQDVNEYPEYKYVKASDFKSIPIDGRLNSYGGGGYMVTLFEHSTDGRPRLQRLRDEGWLDNRTKGIMVEFSNFNAQINMFVSVVMMLEQTRSGAYEPFTVISPAKLYRYQSQFALLLVFAEVMFFVYLVYFIIREQSKASEMGGLRVYLQQFWSYIDMALIVCAVCATVFYGLTHWATNDINHEVIESAGNVYVKIQIAVYFADYFNYFSATCLFLANIKIMQLLKFNRRMRLIIETMHRSLNEVAGFAVMFILVYSAFCSAFYLLLGSKLIQFSTYLLVNEEAFASMLGKFSFTKILEASTLAPWFFFFFMVVQAMILVNMLIAIITNAFVDCKNDEDKQQSEYEVVQMLRKKIGAKLGYRSTMAPRTMADPQECGRRSVNDFNCRFTAMLQTMNKMMDESLDMKELARACRKANKQRQQQAKELVETERIKAEKTKSKNLIEKLNL